MAPRLSSRAASRGGDGAGGDVGAGGVVDEDDVGRVGGESLEAAQDALLAGGAAGDRGEMGDAVERRGKEGGVADRLEQVEGGEGFGGPAKDGAGRRPWRTAWAARRRSGCRTRRRRGSRRSWGHSSWAAAMRRAHAGVNPSSFFDCIRRSDALKLPK